MEVSSPDLCHQVRSNFMDMVVDNLSSVVYPAFHGTLHANITSIFERGFLIPGENNDICRRNGMAYGKGVYFANINAAGLSLQFSSGRPCLIVCAVLQHESVTLVRDSLVVFDTSLCVPLFVVKGTSVGHAPSSELSAMSLSHDTTAFDILHRGYIVSLEVRASLRKNVPAYMLLHQGYSPESLIVGGYTSDVIYERRFHPVFRYVTFSGLQSSLPGVDCRSLWNRLSCDDVVNNIQPCSFRSE
jgi:hypothetical protein